MAIKKLIIVGIVLCKIEMIFVVAWFSIGVYALVIDSNAESGDVKYTEEHMINILHFTGTLALLLILEELKAIDVIKDTWKHRIEKHIDVTGEKTARRLKKHKFKEGYLLSWAISFVVALSTDLFSLSLFVIEAVHLSKKSEKIPIIVMAEIALMSFATLATILTIIWSLVTGLSERRTIHKTLKQIKHEK
jgi:hypothetical protein